MSPFLCYPASTFPVTYVPWCYDPKSLCSPSYVSTAIIYVPQYIYVPRCYVLGLYVSQPNVSWYLCSPVPLYVPWYITSWIERHDFCFCWALAKICWARSLDPCSSVPMFPKGAHSPVFRTSAVSLRHTLIVLHFCCFVLLFFHDLRIFSSIPMFSGPICPL